MSTTYMDEIIRRYAMKPHPEGGYYAETYRCSDLVSVEGLSRFKHHKGNTRSASTAILFLLSGEQASMLHRICSDEIWHFHEGSALMIEWIDQDGLSHQSRLGPQADGSHRYQVVAPAGSWFGASLMSPDRYALVGCTVAPGFDFTDFELGRRSELIARYPQHVEMIMRLTRNGGE